MYHYLLFIMLTTSLPNLHGLFGRKTGEVEGFAYSDANKQKGITWNEDTLVSFSPCPTHQVRP